MRERVRVRERVAPVARQEEQRRPLRPGVAPLLLGGIRPAVTPPTAERRAGAREESFVLEAEQPRLGVLGPGVGLGLGVGVRVSSSRPSNLG